MARGYRFHLPLIFAIGVGLLLSGTTIGFHLYVAGLEHSDGYITALWAQIWIFGGMFLLGAVPAYVSAQYRLLTPVTVSVSIYFLNLYVSAPIIIEHERASNSGILGWPFFGMMLFLWFLPLAAVLAMGGLEYLIRQNVLSN